MAASQLQLTNQSHPLAALISAYDRCKDILRSVGHEWCLSNDDQRALQARISTEHQRLEQWGHRIGLDGPSRAQLSACSDAYLLNRDFHQNTQGILDSIVDIFEETVANLAQHYEPTRSPTAQTARAGDPPGACSTRGGYLTRIQLFLSAKNPTSRWHRQDKVRFMAFAEMIHHHIGVLQRKLDYFESVTNA